MKTTTPRPLLRLCLALAGLILLADGPAFAQRAADARSTPGGGARVQAAYAEWRKLPQREIDCVDRTLRAQRTDLWSLIQRGVEPSDASVGRLRATCRTPTAAAGAQRDSQALAASSDSRAEEAAAKASAEKAQLERIAAERAAERAAAEKAAIAKAAAEKAAADRAATEKAAAEKAAMAEKLMAEQAAAEKAAVERAAAEKKAAEKSAPAKASTSKAAADSAAEVKAAMDAARAEFTRGKNEPTKNESTKPEAAAEHSRKDAARIAEAELLHSAAELRTSFLYGLLSGPLVFCLGGVVFLVLARRRTSPAHQPHPAAAGASKAEQDAELNRLIAAVLAELKRRDGHKRELAAAVPSPASTPEPRAQEAALH